MIIQFDDISMLQLARDINFPLKRFNIVWIGCHLRQHDFNRHRPIFL